MIDVSVASVATLGVTAPVTRNGGLGIDGSVATMGIDVPDGVRRWLDGGMVTTNVGFDLDFEARQLHEATRRGCQLLSIRVVADEALIGPRWIPGQRSACAGCAEARLRQSVDHPLRRRGDLNASPRSGWPAALEVLVDVALNHLAVHPLEPGEMLSVGLARTSRHRVLRSMACPICGPRSGATPISRGCVPTDRPEALAFQPRASGDRVPLRGVRSPAIEEAELPRLVDYRFGPVVQVRRDNRAPFAMSGALVPGSRAMGYGRGGDFARAGAVAILEAYERLGAFPHQGQVIQDLSYNEVRDLAVDPDTLGRYSRAQLDHPNGQVMAYRPDVAMDWAFGHRLDDGEAWLLPADVAFYGYEYQRRLDEPSAVVDGGRAEGRRRHFFAESSSGCALGSSLEEAALHALVELIERDAFLLAWCRRAPLPAIDQGSIDDPTSTMMLDAIDGHGFDVHVLSTTYDLGVPSVWALAVNRDPSAVPATFSAAGSSPVPADALRAALWELAQLVAHPVDWDVDAVHRLVDDPSLVDTIEDHVHLYAMPAMRDRVCQVLGGPVVAMASAFPGWPEQLCQAAQGDVRGALDYLLSQCRAAGLETALVVDQSTQEHRDLGLAVARVVVPGMLPMCFGSPQQRLGGLPRRELALAATAWADVDLMLDPHPFP